jgi:capsular exopolysaccharide synthesis family protein
MSDRLIPQRWNEPSAPFDDGTSIAPHAEQESVLKVLLEFFALIRRNYRIVLATTLGALAILFVQLRLDHPLYRASAVVRFQDKGRALSGGLGGGGAQQLVGPNTDPLLTQIQVLQSRAVARTVVEREGLRVRTDSPDLPIGWLKDVTIDDPRYQDELELTFNKEDAIIRRGATVVRASYGVPARIGGVQLTVARRPGPESVKLSIIPLEGAVDQLLAGLRGRVRERTDIIDVTYENASPTQAQRVANSAADVFQTLNAQSAKQESVRRRQFIEGQLHKTELLLAEAQESHNQFRTQKQVYSSQEKFRNQQSDLTGIELRRRELQADRGMYQSLLQTLQDPRQTDGTGERLGALVSSPGIASNPVVAQLYAQLTRLQGTRDSLVTGPWSASKDNPDIKRLDVLIASTESNIGAAVRGQIAGVDARIAALDELQRRSAGQMAVLPTTEAREAGLLGQVETFRREADRLREELQKAQIEEAAEGGQIDLVDPATLPTRPIGTGRTPRVVFALVIGLALGTLIAYVLENYTSVIRRREDMERVAMVPMLAVVPPLTANDSRGNRLLAWMHPSQNANGNGRGNGLAHRRELVTMVDTRSQAAEAFRTLRTNLLFSSAVQTMRQVIVTSAGPGEGKSTTAANLAVAFAQQGQRVLLIDCDLRRPRIHQVFGHAQIPGLTNALVGNMSSAEAIHTTNIDGLSVLTAGPTPPNPAELLGGSRMGELLDTLAQSYDMVIIDTPPVLIASDAAILSRHVAGTLLVVRAGQTQAAALRDTMQQLATVGTHVTGTVLNDPDGEVAKFSSYYGYYYQDYYGKTPATT